MEVVLNNFDNNIIIIYTVCDQPNLQYMVVAGQ